MLTAGALRRSEDPAYGGYRFSLFPELVAEVTAALLGCTSEVGSVPPTDGVRAGVRRPACPDAGNKGVLSPMGGRGVGG